MPADKSLVDLQRQRATVRLTRMRSRLASLGARVRGHGWPACITQNCDDLCRIAFALTKRFLLAPRALEREPHIGVGRAAVGERGIQQALERHAATSSPKVVPSRVPASRQSTRLPVSP